MKRFGLILCIFAILVLGGCRKINEEPNYRCDSEEWATTVLNDLVEEVFDQFGLSLSAEDLGFIVNKITLLKLDKEEEFSLCRIDIRHEDSKEVSEKIKQETSDNFAAQMLLQPLQLQSLALTKPILERIYQSQPKLKNNGMLPFIVLTLTTALNNNSLYYKVYDNGAGEILYEEYEPESKENSQN